MSSEAHKLSITYSSSLLPPPKLMSTLAVFYDEVSLPRFSPFLGDEEDYSFVHILRGISRDMARTRNEEFNRLHERLHERYIRDRKPWEQLFQTEILKIIPETNPHILRERENALPDNTELDLDRLRIAVDLALSMFPDRSMWMHYLADKPSPELFFSDPSDTRTERLAGFLVHSIFDYQVPQLSNLNAEQILEVRDYLKDTKKGFTYYIHEMTDDVEQRLKGGNLQEIEAAQKTFERKILPLYEEFRRQLVARKTGYWANVLSASADFLKVDATPWTPKFYGELLKWLGVALNFTAKDEEMLLTNKNQAFQYLARLESKVSRAIS
jgi:hypothetical protein